MGNPIADNPLRSRTDLQRAVHQLFEPLKSRFSAGAARVTLGYSGAWFPEVDSQLEGFTRPLWALAPLGAGGGSFDWWDEYRRGLANGTDPDHHEYWGDLSGHDHKAVEMAPLGLALCLVPEKLWAPLNEDEQSRVADWIRQINDLRVVNNNHLLFRIFANLGLRAVDVAHDWDQVQRDIAAIENFYSGDGWYSDGPEGPCDYYNPWELHFDTLVYAVLLEAENSERAGQFRQRAGQFAHQYWRWFACNGTAFPYGRSLSYRFAQGAFWGALGFAGLEALPWGVVKGLWLRNLRWWVDQPIFTDSGLLSIGYAYPSNTVTERYIGPASPYWAMKYFLPLALPANHPFWTAEEEPPPAFTGTTTQAEPEMVICRDAEHDHTFALTTGQGEPNEKYAKFAYSTAFGYGIPDGPRGLTHSAPDSTLLLSTDGQHFRPRIDVVDRELSDGTVYTEWHPWPDVSVETWLAASPPWHVRVHRIDTDCACTSIEGGFPLDKSGDDTSESFDHESAAGSASVHYPSGFSGLRALSSERSGAVCSPMPNTNLLAPRVAVPILRTELQPGSTWHHTAVLGTPGNRSPSVWKTPPSLREEEHSWTLLDGQRDTLLTVEK